MIKNEISRWGAVMSTTREKFATQVDSALLDSVRKLAKSEGRQIQAVIEDALRAHLDDKNGKPGREHVIAAYLKSTESFSGLYKKLAQ
jgi:hypothetical protein